MRFRAFGAATAASLALAASAQAGVINDWNLMVFGNHQLSSNVEGKVMVRGTLSGTGDVGTRLTPANTYLGQQTLVVGGGVNVGNIQLQAGNLRYTGSFSGNVNFNGGGNGASTPSALALANAAYAEVTGVSSFLAGQIATDTLTVPGSPSPVNIVAHPRPDGVAIINVPGTLLSSSNVQQIDINFNGATSVIFNVTGGAVSISGGNFVGAMADPSNASRMLWNFHQAGSVSVQRMITGAFIAPNANVTNTSTIVGVTAVNNFTQNAQVHIPLYTGYIPAPGAMGALAMAGIVAARRRR